jgi:hypothetical protein
VLDVTGIDAPNTRCAGEVAESQSKRWALRCPAVFGELLIAFN